MKRATTINLDPETRERLERARERHALGKFKPSLSEVASEAIARGLPSLLGEEPHGTAGSR
jgi:hypothetical protein